LRPAGAGVATCICDGGFKGADCRTPMFICPRNCSGAGLCLSDPPETASGYPTHASDMGSVGSTPACHCFGGYFGDACELRQAATTVGLLLDRRR
jgi:hypothetical protein